MKVGIIGAGTMGSGIAQAFAQVDGYEVCLCDINEEFASNVTHKSCRLSPTGLFSLSFAQPFLPVTYH